MQWKYCFQILGLWLLLQVHISLQLPFQSKSKVKAKTYTTAGSAQLTTKLETTTRGRSTEENERLVSTEAGGSEVTENEDFHLSALPGTDNLTITSVLNNNDFPKLSSGVTTAPTWTSTGGNPTTDVHKYEETSAKPYLFEEQTLTSTIEASHTTSAPEEVVNLTSHATSTPEVVNLTSAVSQATTPVDLNHHSVSAIVDFPQNTGIEKHLFTSTVPAVTEMLQSSVGEHVSSTDSVASESSSVTDILNSTLIPPDLPLPNDQKLFNETEDFVSNEVIVNLNSTSFLSATTNEVRVNLNSTSFLTVTKWPPVNGTNTSSYSTLATLSLDAKTTTKSAEADNAIENLPARNGTTLRPTPHINKTLPLLPLSSSTSTKLPTITKPSTTPAGNVNIIENMPFHNGTTTTMMTPPANAALTPVTQPTAENAIKPEKTTTVSPHGPNLVEPGIGDMATLGVLKTDPGDNIVLSNKSEMLITVRPMKTRTAIPYYSLPPPAKPPDIDLSVGSDVKLYIKVFFNISLSNLCKVKNNWKRTLALLVRSKFETEITSRQVVLKPLEKFCTKFMNKFTKREATSTVIIYIVDGSDNYNYTLTNMLANALQDKPFKHIMGKLGNIVFLEKVIGKMEPVHSQVMSPANQSSPGIIAAIVVAILTTVILVLLVALFLVYKQHQRKLKTVRCIRHSISSLNDTYQLHALVRNGSGRYGYVNPGLEEFDFGEDFISNPLTEKGCADMLEDPQKIYDEFTLLPNPMAHFTEVPEGAEFKNRYPNVIPNPHSRVLLKSNTPDDPIANYINANFIRGYLGYPKSYIIAQAPKVETVTDFWTMVWQQHSGVIIMATGLVENNRECCPQYWPNTDGGDVHSFFGNYKVTQKNKVVKNEWIQTSLLLTSKLEPGIEKEVEHVWLTAWPSDGIPDHRTILKFFGFVRPLMEASVGPPVIHCCPGTGRSGVLAAVDVAMLAFEHSRKVNIPLVVYQLRLDRGGLVRTKDQYEFIYKVLYEYSRNTSTPSLSTRSSVASTTSLQLANLKTCSS